MQIIEWGFYKKTREENIILQMMIFRILGMIKINNSTKISLTLVTIRIILAKEKDKFNDKIKYK